MDNAHRETGTKGFQVQTPRTGQNGREIEEVVYEVTGFLVVKERRRYPAWRGESQRVFNVISHRRNALTSYFFQKLVVHHCYRRTQGTCWRLEECTPLSSCQASRLNSEFPQRPWVSDSPAVAGGSSGATEESFSEREAQMVSLVDAEVAVSVGCLQLPGGACSGTGRDVSSGTRTRSMGM